MQDFLSCLGLGWLIVIIIGVFIAGQPGLWYFVKKGAGGDDLWRPGRGVLKYIGTSFIYGVILLGICVSMGMVLFAAWDFFFCIICPEC